MSRGFMEPIGCSDCGDCVPIEEANAEIAELRADLKFAVDHGINIYVHEPGFVTIYYGDGMDSLTYEGTPEDIFRVIRKTRKGE